MPQMRGCSFAQDNADQNTDIYTICAIRHEVGVTHIYGIAVISYFFNLHIGDIRGICAICGSYNYR